MSHSTPMSSEPAQPINFVIFRETEGEPSSTKEQVAIYYYCTLNKSRYLHVTEGDLLREDFTLVPNSAIGTTAAPPEVFNAPKVSPFQLISEHGWVPVGPIAIIRRLMDRLGTPPSFLDNFTRTCEGYLGLSSLSGGFDYNRYVAFHLEGWTEILAWLDAINRSYVEEGKEDTIKANYQHLFPLFVKPADAPKRFDAVLIANLTELKMFLEGIEEQPHSLYPIRVSTQIPLELMENGAEFRYYISNRQVVQAEYYEARKIRESLGVTGTVVQFGDELFSVTEGTLESSSEAMYSEPQAPELPSSILESLPNGFCGTLDFLVSWAPEPDWVGFVPLYGEPKFTLIEVHLPYSIGYYGDTQAAAKYACFLRDGWQYLVSLNKVEN
jgi:hypothetical protein